MDTGNIYEFPTKGGRTMAYEKTELEQAIDLVQPQPPDMSRSLEDWVEELQKALVPLRYLQTQSLDQDGMDQMSVAGYLNIVLRHIDGLLAEAYMHGWTNHPQGKEN